MKRRISLLLAVVMILGTFSFAFAADVNEKVDLVTKEGILRGDQGTNALRLDDPLARKEAVVLLSRLMDVEEEADNFEKEGLPTFADVQDAVYYKSFIAWAEDNKYFNGNPDGTFGFNDNLTVKEYAAVLLRALGYAEEVYNVEGWKNVEKLANDLKLLEDVETELNDDATRREVAVMTFNALGAKMKDSDKTLAEFLGIEMPAPDKPTELTAKVKDTENLKEVVLELSNAELVDKDKLENVNNYKVVDNKVEKVEVDGDDVIILLENALLDGREYKLRVRSIDKAINKEYTFKAKDNTIPTVEKVEVLGKNGIKLRTSEPINILDNVRGRTFLVDGKNIAMDVEVYGRDVILTPYYNETFKDDVKTLTVSGLADFAGFRSAKEEFEIEMVKDEVAPKVVDIIVRTDKKVEVVFDKDIYIGSVDAYYDKNNVGNISYESGRHTVYANKATKIDTNKVLYEFKDEFLRTRTDFTIVDVENHSGVAMEKTTMVAREILDNVEPEIYKHEVRSKKETDGTMTTTITLYFDKDVYGFRNAADTQFVKEDHFKLYEREIFRDYNRSALIDSADYAKDAAEKDILDVVVVTLKGLTEWNRTNETDYILEVEGFATDNSLRRSRMYRDYVEFKAQQGTGFVIVTDGIKVTGNKYETQINIEFNKPVDRAIAEDFKNYIFDHKTLGRQDVKDLKGRIVTERDGYEVTIILPDFDVDKFNSFRILDTLKTRTGQRLDRVYVYDFATGFADNADYTITKVDGDFVVTPNAGVKEITLKTDVKGNFIVNGALDKLVIDAPNADVVIKDNVTVKEVLIKAIKGETLTINGTVNKVTVETEKAVSIKANDTNFILISDVKNANVKVNEELVAVEKGEEVNVTVDEEGNVKAETEKGKEEAKKEEAAKLEKATTEVDKLVRMSDVTAAEKAEVQKLVDALADSDAKKELQGKLDAIETVEDAKEKGNKERLGKLEFKIKGIKEGNVQRKIQYAELDTVVAENAVDMLNALITDDELELDEVTKAEILLALKEVKFDKSKIVINAEGEIEVEDGFLVAGWEVLKDERLGAEEDAGYNITLIEGEKEYRITISKDGSATIAAKKSIE